VLSSNISSTFPHNRVNFGPLAAEIGQISTGSRFGSLTARHSSSGCQPNFAALNRGRHLYSAGWPSHLALAHIYSISIQIWPTSTVITMFARFPAPEVRPTLVSECVVLLDRIARIKTTYVDAVCCYRPSSVLCQSVTLVSPSKTAEPIEMPFGLLARMGPRNHVLDGVPDPPWEGAILGERGDPL